jgi:uncharacterized membrane protein
MISGPWTMRRVLLPVSVGLNVFLIFLIASHLFRYRNYRPPGKLERFLATAPLQLSAEDAQRFREVIDRDRRALLEEEAHLRRARDQVIEVLKTNPFDPQGFQQAVDQARDKRSILERSFEKSFLEAAQKISPDGRRQLAELRVNPG